MDNIAIQGSKQPTTYQKCLADLINVFYHDFLIVCCKVVMTAGKTGQDIQVIM